MLDPERIYGAEKDVLLKRLIFVTADLCEVNRSLFEAKVHERRKRDACIMESDETSVAGQNRDADLNTFEERITVFDLEAQLHDYREERDLLRFLLGLE